MGYLLGFAAGVGHDTIPLHGEGLELQYDEKEHGLG